MISPSSGGRGTLDTYSTPHSIADASADGPPGRLTPSVLGTAAGASRPRNRRPQPCAPEHGRKVSLPSLLPPEAPLTDARRAHRLCAESGTGVATQAKLAS